MRTHRIATAGVLLAVLLATPLALAQQEKSKEECAPGKSVAPPRKMEVTTIAGLEAINQDNDLDMSVGTSELTSAAPAPGTRDVIESRPERRREQQGRRGTVAPLFGYGTGDFGIGVGIRGGYTFPNPIYVGGTFMYHGGDNNNVDRPNLRSSSTRYYYPGVEVGYDIGLGPMLFRPYVGGGILFGRLATVDTNGGAATNTESAIMIYPGLTAQYVLPRSPLFVGGDARVLLPFENQTVSLSLFATTGLYL